MTAFDLLLSCQAAGVVLHPVGDKLQVSARSGALTPELRASLVEHKTELIALLSLDWIPLNDGPAVPLDALRFAWNVEDRGALLSVDDAGRVTLGPPEVLTDQDRQQVTRWACALALVARYCDLHDTTEAENATTGPKDDRRTARR